MQAGAWCQFTCMCDDVWQVSRRSYGVVDAHVRAPDTLSALGGDVQDRSLRGVLMAAPHFIGDRPCVLVGRPQCLPPGPDERREVGQVGDDKHQSFAAGDHVVASKDGHTQERDQHRQWQVNRQQVGTDFDAVG